MNLGVGSRGYVIFEEKCRWSQRTAFWGWGKQGTGKLCVCMCVSVCVPAHTLKIGVHLNMLRTKIHIAKKEKLKTIAREVKAERR